MYSYSFDIETGGLILNSTPTIFSKEPRPVYSSEMNLLGFNEFWDYDCQDDIPYMWCESNVYWYKGQAIAKIKGGDLYHAPILSPYLDDNGRVLLGKETSVKLSPIDINGMNEKNKELLSVMEETTVKMIVKEYEKFKDKLDIFHVAFSGGKDSAVLLDLVKKALPKGSFVVIFGDTGMEFPDTYKAVELTKEQCEKDGTPFYIARSHFNPEDSWKVFGPPARVLRWCCSVHKSTPQTLKMRELCGKNNYTGLDFVGVRKEESLARSKYDFENFGKKQKGQYSYNPILDWTSAEIWLYIFANGLYVNEAYKKGNSRAGCLFCPMSGGQSDFFRRESYPAEIDMYVGYIKDSYNNPDPIAFESYLTNGGWNARNNGRALSNNPFRCVEDISKGVLSINVIDPKTKWEEWIKTIGLLTVNGDKNYIQYKDQIFEFTIKNNDHGYTVSIDELILKNNPRFGKLFRQVFRKATYCIGCKVCETNCHHGSIKFVNGQISINNCIHCQQCHEIDDGCLLYHSVRHPQGGGKNMKSLNSFADHAPKREWLVSFFDLKDDFFTNHTLGPMMFDMFRRFLKDAGLNEKNHYTAFAELIGNLGWESETALGLVMINLTMDNPQIAWYVNNFDIDYYYEKNKVEDMLIACDVKPKDAKSIVKAYKRITDTPFGDTLNFGHVFDEDIVRCKWNITDNRVVLYGLYKFAEKCNLLDSAEFHLSYLFDESIEKDGISPVRMFGIVDEEEWKSILLGLTSAYPDFINATFTNDLKTITLKDKTSADVLNLFREDM